jgi:ABC-type branched-subunit amino acid transport system ATPase component
MAFVAVNGVAKYFDRLAAVDGVTFEVGEGQILAIVGPNGAGKSTLLKTISGIERPSAGTVVLAGVRVDGLPPHQVRRRGIATVMQTPLVFGSMTALEDVTVGAMFGCGDGTVSEHVANERARDALAFVGLADRSARPVHSLTLHEQRFLELARAIAGRPRVLLVDEVMAGLNDVELAASIEMLRAARDRLGMTIIWVEHVMRAVLTLAERVLVLNFGKMLFEGVPQAVMRHPAVIDAYLGKGHDA